MSTISGNLALLQRTKAGQRALLEEMYPDMDFSTVPFREYGRLFTGRKYVPGFVGGWKTYGRSNSEDPAKREILPDYSGNGRDIRLYNFAFSGMSGYGGYAQDWNFRPNNSIITTTTTTTTTAGMKARIDNKKGGEITSGFLLFDNLDSSSLDVETRINGGTNGVVVRQTESGGKNPVVLATINAGETGSFVCTSENYNAGKTFIMISVVDPIPEGGYAEFTILPQYPGGLVSDGVDDYGECIKGFALPDDYTVVAIRKIFNTASDSALASKSRTTGQGAFIFDINQGGYSYGNISSGSYNAPLFSYQTKTSYNGVVISPGSGTDTEDDTLCLFKKGVNRGDYLSAVLYDLRIYDHSLTAEELQAVKDEMMADYENATGGGINDITYVADWDGKGRSNDEDEPMRNQWIDKATGKVINLSNFSFSEMSGWNGYLFDWSSGWNTDYKNLIVTKEYGKTKVRFSGLENLPTTQVTLLYQTDANIPALTKIRFRISGLEATELFILIDNTNPSVIVSRDGDGILEYTSEVVVIYPRLSVVLNSLANREISIEQLPLYPGALVSDGVDDYGRTAEVIDEQVGTMLVYGDYLTTNAQYMVSCGLGSEDTWLYATQDDNNGVARMGRPNKTVTDTMPMASLTRDQASPNGQMILFNAGDRNYACAWLARLILIREQLDDAAVEFLKWKVDKEYRDWCKANGYEYAINQLTE